MKNYGGELGQVLAELKNIKPEYPEHISERIGWARKMVSDIRQENSLCSDMLSLEERERNQALLAEALPIVTEFENIGKACEDKRKALAAKQKQIETQIERVRSRQVHLTTVFKRQMDANLSELKKDLHWAQQKYDRDRVGFYNELAELDNQAVQLTEILNKLREKQGKRLLVGKEKLTIEIFENEALLKQLEIRKSNIYSQQYPHIQRSFSEQESRIQDLQRQINGMEANFQEALADCDTMLVQLCGEAH